MLHVERSQGVVSWRIDRPDARNALDFETMTQLAEAVRAAAADPSIRAATLSGEGHMFVSGGDLRELRPQNTRQDAERLSDAGWELCRALEELPFPVIAALSGPAVGGGAELALACDIRIADVRAKLSFKQVRLGVTTAWGTVPRLVQAVGAGTAARLLYTAHEIDAAHAKLLGLVDEVVDNGLARTTALAWAADIAEGSPRAVAEMKRIVRAACDPAPSVRALERRLFAETWSGPDHAEAVEAFFERRAPVWGDR